MNRERKDKYVFCPVKYKFTQERTDLWIYINQIMLSDIRLMLSAN